MEVAARNCLLKKLIFLPFLLLSAFIYAKKIKVVAAPYDPFVFVEDGQIQGFDVDLLNTICAMNGWEYELEMVNFKEVLRKLLEKEADVGIGAIYVTSARKRIVNFTEPYLKTGLVAVIKPFSSISMKALDGKKVGVKKGATGEQLAKNWKRKFNRMKIIAYPTTEESLDALIRGEVDLVLNDYLNTIALSYRKYKGQLFIKKGLLGVKFLTRNQIAFPVRKDRTDLLEAFNLTLKNLKKSGYIQFLSDKWLHVQVPPNYGKFFFYGGFSLLLIAVLLTGIVGYLRAVQTEKALAQYMEMVESSPEPIAIIQEGRIVYVNKAGCELFDAEESEILNRPIGRYFSPNILAALKELSSAVLRKSISKEEGKLLTEEGEEKDVEISALRLKYKGKDSIQIMFRDVTEAKRTRDALKESEFRFRAAVENAPNPVVIFNERGEVLITNKQFHETTGLKKKSIIVLERWLNQAIPDRNRRRKFLNKIMTVFSEERPIRIQEVEFICGSEENKRLWAVEVTLIGRWKDSKLAMLVGRDITEYKLLEAKLLHTQKMEAVGRLAGGIAHDFNNLLNVVLGFGELALNELASHNPVREYVEQIMEAGKKAAELASGLLAFSKRSTMKESLVNLNEIILRMEKILKRIIGEDIEFLLKLDEKIALIKADPVHIESTLVNLIVNARDAMPKGGVLTVETRREILKSPLRNPYAEIPPGDYTLLIVSDTGIGMDDYVKGRVFEPYFTTKKDRKDRAGLGLSTVYGMITQIGGYVHVESEVGKGSTFFLYFPSQKEVEEREEVEEERVLELSGRETILVVEDEDQVRKLLEKLLRAHGYDVIVAEGPTEAMQIMASKCDEVDLLLTDVIMPGMSGIELARHLRQEYPSLKVMFISGYTGEYISQRETLEEELEILQKPFTTEALLKKVREILERG